MRIYQGVFKRRGTGVDEDAAALFAAMSPTPDEARQALYIALISGLKLDNVWPWLDALYIRAAHAEQAALLNVRQRLYDSSAQNAPTFTTDRGFTFSGTAHIATGFNPVTASSPQFSQNSGTVYAYVNAMTSNINSTAVAIGVNTTSGTLTFIRPLNTSGLDGRVNGGINSVFTTLATRLGGSMLSRTGAFAVDGYRNGAAVGATSTAPALPMQSLELMEGRLGAVYNAIDRVAATAYGAGLDATQSAALHTRITTFLTAIGAN
jgi:hypothetical protein